MAKRTFAGIDERGVRNRGLRKLTERIERALPKLQLVVAT